MTRHLRILLPVLALVACLLAQEATGTLEIRVTDPSGAVVPGANVAIANQGTGLKRSTVTDTAGEYRFAGLSMQPGRK